MKSNFQILALGLLLTLPTHAASFTIGGGSTVAFLDSSAATISTSSIVQVGYFSGISTLLDPSSYSNAQWNTFTPISGIDSLNPSKDTNVNAVGGPGTFGLSLGLTTGTDALPPTYPVRLGIRVYDSTTTTTGTEFNTVSAFVNDWILNDPDVLPAPTAPNLLILSAAEPGIAWQADGANAFKTTITAVPEPSSFALLGLGGMALLFRRRK